MINPKGKRVVYWLGAGASANALPVVTQMGGAMRSQDAWIRHYLRTGIDEKVLSKYSTFLWGLADTIVPYGTVDTYARALFVQKRSKDLAELKLHLAIFFLLEQTVEKKNRLRHGEEKPEYDKPTMIDQRYMGWLALLVEEDKCITDKVRVISWNYDLQVEHALAKYWELPDLSELHKIRGGQIHPKALEPVANHAPFIIHLNGIAGHAISSQTTSFLYGPLNSNDPRKTILYLFDIYKDYDLSDGSVLNSMVDTMTFAWENKAVGNRGMELAKEALHQADIIVIIGYSFPSFNRKVDKELFSAFVGDIPQEKKVVVQNPTMAVETFQQIMGIDGHHPNVLVERSTDQFHIPPEFF